MRRTTGDALAEPAALERFLAEHDVHPDALANGRRPTDGDLDEVYALRREVRGILEAVTEDRVVDDASALVAGAGIAPARYRDADDRWQWHVATAPRASVSDELAVLIGMGLLGVMRTLGHDRLRHCASAVCDGMFVDTSRAGRRRYCCPNCAATASNVANHRARRAAGR